MQALIEEKKQAIAPRFLLCYPQSTFIPTPQFLAHFSLIYTKHYSQDEAQGDFLHGGADIKGFANLPLVGDLLSYFLRDDS